METPKTGFNVTKLSCDGSNVYYSSRDDSLQASLSMVVAVTLFCLLPVFQSRRNSHVLTKSPIGNEVNCCEVDNNGGYLKHVNPYVTNGLSHPYHLDGSTFIYRGISN